MQFLHLSQDDWHLFLQWAVAEGWTVPFQEQRLFQSQWRQHFFALREQGAVRGFVSALAYKKSGWIGNLLVDPECRGLGYGAALFDFALDLLRQARLPRIWLTASAEGAPLYQRRGFLPVDRVERWHTKGLGQLEFARDVPAEKLLDLDSQCWRESRKPLLRELIEVSEICHVGASMALLQPAIINWQLGPWLSPDKCPRSNRLLLQQARQKTTLGKNLLIDVLVSAEMELVLRNAGFDKRGGTELMVLSQQPVQLDGVVALASMGSIG